MAPTTHKKFTTSASQARVIEAAIEQWADRRLISHSLASQLLASINVEDSFDWQRFAKYTFRLAIICVALALLSALLDDAFMRLIEQILAVPAEVRSLITAAIAAAVHYWGYQRQMEKPRQVWANESVHALGGLVIGLAALQLAEACGYFISGAGSRSMQNLNWILLLLATVYGTTGLITKSNLIWSTAMIVLGFWFQAITWYVGGVDILNSYELSRYVGFGSILTATGYAMRQWEPTIALWSSTRIWGLLYLFSALWMLSIFGDDQLFSGNEWDFFIWSALFAAAAGYCIVQGIRYHDGTLKGFGMAYMGLHLCTKFFDLFWSAWYKPFFFAVLAVSLAVAGHYAENIWNLQLQI